MGERLNGHIEAEHIGNMLRCFCNSQTDGCDGCRYGLLSDITDVPCCVYWICDNLNVQRKTAMRDVRSVSIPDKIKKSGVRVIEDLIDVASGKNPGESQTDFNRRRERVLIGADSFIETLETI